MLPITGCLGPPRPACGRCDNVLCLLTFGGRTPEAVERQRDARTLEQAALLESGRGPAPSPNNRPGDDSTFALAACFRSIGWPGDVYGEVQRAPRLAEGVSERECLAVTASFKAVIAASGQDPAAEREYRAAVRSWTRWWTRVNYELVRWLLRQRRPRKAIAVFAPARRGAKRGSCPVATAPPATRGGRGRARMEKGSIARPTACRALDPAANGGFERLQ